MAVPPVVADLLTEVVAGMDEKEEGLLEEEVTRGGDMFHDQASAPIMIGMTYGTPHYTVLAASRSWGKKGRGSGLSRLTTMASRLTIAT
jgi:hypothetical protein